MHAARLLLSGDHLPAQLETSATTGETIASPVRKHRRQSLPDRLSARRPSEQYGGVAGAEHNPGTSVAPAEERIEIGEEPPTPPRLDHLTKDQKAFYLRVFQICDATSSYPLPMTVTRITGRGELFDRGDPVPKRATILVEGSEGPLVERLRLSELLSAALAERARRRNDQMDSYVFGALGLKRNEVAASAKTGGGDGDGDTGEDETSCNAREGWWSQLCANKHLTEGENFERVRDGEPLGTVADGVEWALLQKHPSTNTTLPCGIAEAVVDTSTSSSVSLSCSGNQDNVATLVEVARLWAGCLTWELVSRGDWSYPGLTTRLLKQNTRGPQVEIFFSIHAGEEERGARGKRAEGACWGIGKEAKNIQEERRRSAGDWRGRATLHLNSGRFSDCAEGEGREEEVVLWSSLARDLSSNLAGVFKVDGVEEATRKAAAAMIWRTKVMARCYSILRVALQDIIEGKASTGMLEGENDTEVTESCLLWLEETIAPKVSANCAHQKEAVSQVTSCIKLSIEGELNVSEAVRVWCKENLRATRAEAGAVDEGKPTKVPTEKEFSALKRKEAAMAQDIDTVAIILLHSLFLVLPCKPFSFHFTWGRFMRFYHETNLEEHVAKYYGDTSGQVAADGEINLAPHQVARNLVKPLHPSTLALPSPFSLPPVANDAGRGAQLQQVGASEREGMVAAGGVVSTAGRRKMRQEGTPTLSPAETAVANECLVCLLAVHGTASRLATCAQVTSALRREGFPDANESLALLKDVHALKGRGVSERLWRKRRVAALVRLRVEESIFARLPSDLFRSVLVYLAS